MYNHQLIRGLHLNNRKPSYIPSRVFALALLDRLTAPGEVPDKATVERAISGDARAVNAALRLLMADAQGDYERFVENVEVWFNHGMERVTGWYKRYTQGILVLLAVPLTMVVNADSLDIGCAMWKDPTLRARFIAEAGRVDASPRPPAQPEELADVIANTDPYVASLRSVRLPIGWEPSELPADQQGRLRAAVTRVTGCRPPGSQPSGWGWLQAWGDHWAGWLITVLAISLGSPFWFDMLNKLIAIRGDGKAPEEAPKKPKQEQPALGPGERADEARRLEAGRPR